MAQASPDQATADSASEAEHDPEAQSAGGPADPEQSAAGQSSSESETAAPPAAAPAEAKTEPSPSAGTTPSETTPSQAPVGESASSAPQAGTEPPASAESSPEGGSSDSGQLDPAESQAALTSVGEGGAEPSMGGGGGGGGGAPAKEEQPEPPPDVSSQPPEAGLASLNGLPPTAIAAGLGSVAGAVSRDVGQQRAEHAANPPKLECPSGSPVVKSGPTPVSSSPAPSVLKTKNVPGGADRELPAPPPLAAPPPAPTHAVPAPMLPPSDSARMSESDAQQVQASVGSMPTSDPGLSETAGPAPQVPLSGSSDPAKMQTQRGELTATSGRCETQGHRDAAQPLGEDQIYPTVTPETLQAESGAAGGPAGGQGAKIGGAVGGGGDTETAVSILAQKQSGPQIQAAVTKAQGDIAQRRQEHQTKVEDERANNREQVTALETENAGQQSAARTQAQGEVRQARTDWNGAQQDATVSAGAAADSEAIGGTAQVQQEVGSANQEAGRHITSGNTEAAGVRRQAESDATQKRQEAKQESGGVLGWIASKAKAFFDRLKRGITAIFDKARALVRKAIEAAKKFAVAAIERARKRIVALIRKVGDKLIAIGDKLLAAFPKLRERFRQRIKQLVEKAEAAVNRLAKALKKGVQRLLDLLGKAINAALGLLEKGMKAAVDAANAVVQGAIKAARAVADAFGAFIALVKDVASDPGGWISKLGTAVVDGIRNHLWKAFKTAIKEWFNAKLEEVLGLPGMIWGLLRKGGIALKEVGKMAWEALKSAIPIALITILVEKLVAMIVPAAGAVIAIIEGLQAAWGTVSRIIAAFGKFFAFLKAVRGGGAGPQFAEAVAAAAIVVIDFVSNWLLKKVRGAASKVGSKVKAIAQKIMARLKRGASRVGRTLKRVGAKILAPFKRAREKFKQWREKRRQKKAAKPDHAKKQQDKEKAKRERMDKAIAAIRPPLQTMLNNGTTGIALRARLLFWQVRHRLRYLGVGRTDATRIKVVARNSPEQEVAGGYMPASGTLRPMISSIIEELLTRPDVLEVSNWMGGRHPTSGAQLGSKAVPHEVPGGIGTPAFVARERANIASATPGAPPRNLYANFAGGTTSSESILNPSSTNAFVRLGAGSAYPELGGKLDTIAAQGGMSNRGLAASMRSVVQEGFVPGPADHRTKQMAGITHLMFGRESIRRPENLAYASMTLMQMERGQMTTHDAFAGHQGVRSGGGGAFPMSMEGAQGAAGDLAAGRDTAGARELAHRELTLAAKWLSTEMAAENLHSFRDEQHARDFIRKKILDFYKMSHHGRGSPGGHR